jgi:hypothetical protein
MAAPRNRIGEVLVKARVIDEMQLRSALAQHDQWGGRLSRIISDMGIVTEDAMTQAISQGMGVQRVQLGNLQKDPGALAKLEVGFAEQKGVFPVALRDNGKTLVLAMADPSDLQTIDQVAARSRTRVVPMVAGDREIEHAILRHYRNQEPNVTHSAHSTRRDSAGQADADEFKIVDISGKTVMKNISDIAPRLAEQNAREQAAAAAAAARPSGGGSSAADLLDEILSTSPSPSAVFSPEEMQRLEAVKLNQEKSSKILRALLQLLLEKGMLQQKELAARMRS